MEGEEPKELETDIKIAVGIMCAFSVIGVIGNGLVLYGFTRARSKYTSTIFILTLAGTDFTTCLITIPATIAIELNKFEMENDILCKIFHFLTTSTISFSALTMVMIAIDRYFCICRPFMRVMTVSRAGVLICMSVIIAFVIGIFICLSYGVYVYEIDVRQSNLTSLLNETSTIDPNLSPEEIKNNLLKAHDLYKNESGLHNKTDELKGQIVMFGHCYFNHLTFGKKGAQTFKTIHSAFYAVCVIAVIFIYCIIYVFILKRRRRRLRNESFPCCTFKQSPIGENDNTEIVYLGNDATTQTEDINLNESSCSGKFKNGFTDRTKGVLHSKLEKIRMNNIKTALMLSIVAVIFIIVFLPAWLMMHDLIDFNVTIFYLYFTYNVSNPFVYAFMNPDFRKQMIDIFKTWRKVP